MNTDFWLAVNTHSIGFQVECRLGLFKTGEDALELKEDKAPHSGKEHSQNVHNCDLAFSEIPWGGAAHEFILSIKKLEESHWESIHAHSAEFMGRFKQIVNHEGGECDKAIQPHACIQIDW